MVATNGQHDRPRWLGCTPPRTYRPLGYHHPGRGRGLHHDRRPDHQPPAALGPRRGPQPQVTRQAPHGDARLGPLAHAPAASGVEMATSYLQDLKKQLPCAAYLNGEYGVKDLYAGVPVIIGSGGVEKVVELELNSEEKDNFEKSIQAVRDLFKDAQKIDPSLK